MVKKSRHLVEIPQYTKKQERCDTSDKGNLLTQTQRRARWWYYLVNKLEQKLWKNFSKQVQVILKNRKSVVEG